MSPGVTLTAAVHDAALASPAESIPAAPGPLDHFTITTEPATAGTAFIATATAYDADGNVKTDYDGTSASLTTTLANAPDGTPPTVPANFEWGAGTGVGTASLTATKAEPTANQTVTVTDDSVSEDSAGFSVLPAGLAGFTIDSPITDPQTAGQAFTVDATAYDLYGNVKTDYAGGASITQDLADSPGCATCSPVLTAQAPDYGTFETWVDGQSSVDVTAYNAQTGVSVTVEDGSIQSAASPSFEVSNATDLGGFTVSTTGPATKTAGVGFTANATPYDLYGNVNKTYVGSPTLSGLANSPGCSTCSPALSIAGPSYGILWVSNGGGGVQVTAVKMQPGATLTVTDTGPGVGNSTSFDVTAGTTLGGFTIDNTIVSPRTAGGAFTVNATAYDLYGNVKTDYAGGASIRHNLTTSPGCATCSPALSAQAPDYGTFAAWANGQSSVNVTAYNAQTGVTVTVDHGSIHSAASTTFAVAPATLGGFTIDNTIVSPRTAGIAFAVNATAYDLYGNVKTNYLGGATVTGNLNPSPGFPPAAGTAPTYGPFLPVGSWTSGSKSAQVTDFKAEALRNVTVVDGSIHSAASNSFTVQPNSAANIVFSDADVAFNGQPFDTKKDTPIYHECVRATSGTLPCDASASTKVKVLVRDTWGNAVANGTNIAIAATTKPSGSSLTGTTTAATAAGVATFGTPNALVVTPTGTTGGVQFTASVGAVTRPSNLFQLVNDLEACTGTSCDNVASAVSYGRITPGTSGAAAAALADPLAGVTLTTQQLANNVAHCRGQTTQVGKTTDVHVQGFGVSAARPKFTVALIIPAATLKAAHVQSRNADSFNICLGTTWDGGGDDPPAGSTVPIWQQKRINGQVPALAERDNSTQPSTYWGWLLNCSSSLPSTNPCISLRTKNAGALQSALGLSSADFKLLGFKSGDLGIVYLTQTPWDAKGSIF